MQQACARLVVALAAHEGVGLGDGGEESCEAVLTWLVGLQGQVLCGAGQVRPDGAVGHVVVAASSFARQWAGCCCGRPGDGEQAGRWEGREGWERARAEATDQGE